MTKSSADSSARAEVEGDDHGAVDAALGQELELLLEAGQLLGRRLGTDHGSGVAVEGDDHGGQSGGLGAGRQVAQQGAVPQVDPVIGPDRDSGSLAGRHRDRG